MGPQVHPQVRRHPAPDPHLGPVQWLRFLRSGDFSAHFKNKQPGKLELEGTLTLPLLNLNPYPFEGKSSTCLFKGRIQVGS